jgi:thymidylate synthase (FAD)
MSDPALVIPDAVSGDPRASAIWEDFVVQVKRTYRDLRDIGVLKEDARFVLPNAAATRIVVTMNFRELRHFFTMRIAPEAQWEIRRVGIRMLELLAPHAPTIFGEMLADFQARYPAFFAGPD